MALSFFGFHQLFDVLTCAFAPSASFDIRQIRELESKEVQLEFQR